MNINTSFSYQFEDRRWPEKLGIGALISLVPILNLTVVGYMVQIIRNVAANHAQPLPSWDDLGSKFRDGLMLAAASLVYLAPALIVLCLPLGLLFVSGAITQNSDLQDLGRMLGGIGGGLFLCLSGIFVLYALLLSILRPIILILYSRDGTFASCFRFGEIIRILTEHAVPFFTTWLVVVGASLAVGLLVGFVNLVAGWIPCLGLIVGLVLATGSAIYLLTIDAHLYGEFRVAALGTAEPSLPPGIQ
jgi:hypothetical protein